METQIGRDGRDDGRLRRVGPAICAGLMGGVAGWLGGGLAGANYGGNYATEFELVGLRGYEATGLIGEVVGFIAVALLCFFVTHSLTRCWSRPA